MTQQATRTGWMDMVAVSLQSTWNAHGPSDPPGHSDHNARPCPTCGTPSTRTRCQYCGELDEDNGR